MRLLLRADRGFVSRMLHDRKADVKMPDARCVLACTRTCNPFSSEDDCKKQCKATCLAGRQIIGELSAIVTKFAKVDGSEQISDDVRDCISIQRSPLGNRTHMLCAAVAALVAPLTHLPHSCA